MAQAARDFHQLMFDLGYDRYVAQGGDWGSAIAQACARLFPQHCVAIHTNCPTPAPPRGFDAATDLVSDAERQSYERFMTVQNTGRPVTATGMGYTHIQQTRPQSLSYGLNDSPVGLLAWIVEKFRQWSDCSREGGFAAVYTRDELLTNVAIYWFSGSIGSSMRMYYERCATAHALNTVRRRRSGSDRADCLSRSASSCADSLCSLCLGFAASR